MSTILVSVGMPVFNEAKYLDETLKSLIDQTYHNYELIICDNASTDGTAEICRHYATKDNRIRYVRNETNIGGTANAKKVVDLASGKYFMWAASHDLWSPDFIEKCVDVLETQSNVVLCCAKSNWIDKKGKDLGPVEGIIDTRGLGRKERINFVLWGFQNGAPIFGMYRKQALDAIQLGGQMLAPDRVAIYEIAFLGDIAHVADATFFFRKTEGEGSVKLYISKMIGREPTRQDYRRLMYNMYKAHFRAITKHYNSKRAWPGMMLSCVYALRTHYWNYFKKG